MGIRTKDLNLHPTLTGAKIIELFFGNKGTEYLRAYNPDNRPGEYFQAIKDFKLWISRAIEAGTIQVDEYYHTGGFEHGTFDKGELFRWMQPNDIFQRLEERGVKITSALKKLNVPKADAAPTTGKGKTKSLKSKFFNICKKLKKKNEPFTFKSILTHPDWPDALEDSGYSRTHQLPQGTASNWLTAFRKSS